MTTTSKIITITSPQMKKLRDAIYGAPGGNLFGWFQSSPSGGWRAVAMPDPDPNGLDDWGWLPPKRRRSGRKRHR